MHERCVALMAVAPGDVTVWCCFGSSIALKDVVWNMYLFGRCIALGDVSLWKMYRFGGCAALEENLTWEVSRSGKCIALKDVSHWNLYRSGGCITSGCVALKGVSL